ncbi:MAG: hypothetical protein AB1468_04630 [Candidatus Micrarchaeota archaeon]
MERRIELALSARNSDSERMRVHGEILLKKLKTQILEDTTLPLKERYGLLDLIQQKKAEEKEREQKVRAFFRYGFEIPYRDD